MYAGIFIKMLTLNDYKSKVIASTFFSFTIINIYIYSRFTPFVKESISIENHAAPIKG